MKIFQDETFQGVRKHLSTGFSVKMPIAIPSNQTVPFGL